MTTPYQHWNKVFSTKTDTDLGWHEKDASQTLKFVDYIPNWNKATIFLPGAGTSVLVDELLARGAHVVLNDISDEALEKLKDRISGYEDQVTWLHHDISKPLPGSVPPCNIWLDRAVLHFLLDEKAILGYFENLRNNLSAGGYVLFAEFSVSGAPMCAGLSVHRYSTEELTERLGEEFSLLRQEDYIFINPFGDPRRYIYALYKRK